MEEIKLQTIFDINTIIEKLKTAINKEYNFEVTPSRLKTDISLFFEDNFVSLEIQNRYAKLNEDFKKIVNEMIKELEDKRDNLMLKAISKNNNENT